MCINSKNVCDTKPKDCVCLWQQSHRVASLWLMTPLSVMTSLRRSSRCTFPCRPHKQTLFMRTLLNVKVYVLKSIPEDLITLVTTTPSGGQQLAGWAQPFDNHFPMCLCVIQSWLLILDTFLLKPWNLIQFKNVIFSYLC